MSKRNFEDALKNRGMGMAGILGAAITTVPVLEEDEEKEIYVTVKIREDRLEKLKDLSYQEYKSQKELIGEALDLFFQQKGTINKRPESVIKQEQKKRKKMSKPKNKKH